MPPPPIRFDGASVDLSSRYYNTSSVTGSPAAASETIIATLTIGGQIAVQQGVYIAGWCAFTMGTSGVSANLRIRQTNASGTIISASGAVTGVAAALYAPDIQGFDAAAALPGQVYVMTLTIGSGAASSTVSAVSMFGIVV